MAGGGSSGGKVEVGLETLLAVTPDERKIVSIVVLDGKLQIKYEDQT